MQRADPAGFRCGYVAIIGEPNVGKSTLLNALIGQKLAIVTRKAQTTRHRLLGILTEPGFQVVFLDTPGVLEPRYGLQRRMMENVRSALYDADVILAMVDTSRKLVSERLLQVLSDRPAILVINKIDLVSQVEAIQLADRYLRQREFDAIVPISARKRTNLNILKDEIVARLPEGPPFYPPDQVTEHPERFFVAELIREEILERYHQEIPYATQVNIVAFESREKGKDLIDAEVVVERESQKAIIIGKGGKALRSIGRAARIQIEELLERPVYLRLFVKVRERWRDSETYLREYGYRGEEKGQRAKGKGQRG